VPKITCPVLLVHGADSRVQRVEDAERLRDRLPNGNLVSIPNAGHTVQGDRPREFAAAVREFPRENGYYCL
jgi:pimeloyl-ACP methyl ester carboxylesterase